MTIRQILEVHPDENGLARKWKMSWYRTGSKSSDARGYFKSNRDYGEMDVDAATIVATFARLGTEKVGSGAKIPATQLQLAAKMLDIAQVAVDNHTDDCSACGNRCLPKDDIQDCELCGRRCHAECAEGLAAAEEDRHVWTCPECNVEHPDEDMPDA